MKEFKMIIVGIIIACIIAFSFKCITIIDSGEIGVPVLFGKVQDYTLKEGINIINPFVKIVKYPVRVQAYTMSSTPREGDIIGDDSVSIKTQDGLSVKIDMTVWWRIDKDNAFNIYREIAKSYEEIIPKILRPSVRTVIRDVAVKFTMNDLYTTRREEFVHTVSSHLANILKAKYLVLDRVLVRKIILPQEVEEAIARKMKTMQEAEEMEYRKQIAQKEAEIREIEAKGLARAQEIINASLTPLYIQLKAIEVYKELVKSKNTTFVIMPTSPKGVGVPLIINPNNK